MADARDETREAYITTVAEMGDEEVEEEKTASSESAEPGSTTENVEAVLQTGDLAPSGRAFSVFSPRTKLFLVLMTVFATFFSPFSSFIYLPAITPIADEYHRSVADINLSVTLYQVMQAVAPLFFGDLSDQIGRRPVYALTFIIYLGANIGLALQHSYAALLVLRAVQSTGSSATVAVGSAVMADFATSADRGGYITAVQASIMFAPALAPVLGGILTEFLGWRSTFWFLTIAAGVFVLLYLPFVPESARSIVGDGSLPPPPFNRNLPQILRHHRQAQPAESAQPAQTRRPRTGRRIPIPNLWAAVRIAFEKDVGPLLLFLSLFVMASYAMLVPLQDVIRRRYNFNDLQVGLCYIPFAVGSVVGSLLVGRLLNHNYARVAASIGVTPDRKRGDDLRRFPIERARLDVMWPGVFVAVATTICWGWVVDSGVSLAAPLVVLFFAGAGLSGPMSVLTTLLVDLYPMNPGRVSSTFNLTRAALSAAGTAVVQYMIDAWGYGFTYLFLGLLVLAASPAVLVVRRWGPGWREERYQRFERARKEEQRED